MHVESQVWSLVWLFGLCGCVWLVVCDNSVWFWGFVLGLVGVSLTVWLCSGLVVFTSLLVSCWGGLVGVVSLC